VTAYREWQRRVRASRLGERNAVDAHRPCDVLDLPYTQILKAEIELVADLAAHDPGDADAARLGQGFETSRDIDAVPVGVVLVDDDVAEIDADAELDAGTLSLRNAISRCSSTAQRTASTTLANSTKSPSPVVLTMRSRSTRSRPEFMAGKSER
jgi:hypothetical protein